MTTEMNIKSQARIRERDCFSRRRAILFIVLGFSLTCSDEIEKIRLCQVEKNLKRRSINHYGSE